MNKMFSTNEAAALLGLQPQTLRKRYCLFGSYFGIRPIKLGNGKLRWPYDAINKFYNGEA